MDKEDKRKMEEYKDNPMSNFSDSVNQSKVGDLRQLNKISLVIRLIILIIAVGILFFIYFMSNRPMNMNTVLDEPNFIGRVEEVSEQSILVRVNEDEEEIRSSDLISVSLDVEIKDSLSDYSVGHIVQVYYDGSIAESYPAQVNNVYAIVIVDKE